MPIIMRDLTDLLHGLVTTEYWFVTRWHQNKYYYLYSYDRSRRTAHWTLNKNISISYSYEKAADSVANILSEHCNTIDITYEKMDTP